MTPSSPTLANAPNRQAKKGGLGRAQGQGRTPRPASRNSAAATAAARTSSRCIETAGLREKILKINWKTDLSGGIQRVAIANNLAPFGNGKARALVWNFPDPVPVHREPLYTLAARPPAEISRPTRTAATSACRCSTGRSRRRTTAGKFPMVLTSGRLVEFEGGGDETRSNKWLAEFQQEMFAEINGEDAKKLGITERQVRSGCTRRMAPRSRSPRW